MNRLEKRESGPWTSYNFFSFPVVVLVYACLIVQFSQLHDVCEIPLRSWPQNWCRSFRPVFISPWQIPNWLFFLFFFYPASSLTSLPFGFLSVNPSSSVDFLLKLFCFNPELQNWIFTINCNLVWYPEHSLLGEFYPFCRGYCKFTLSTPVKGINLWMK